MAPRFPHQWVGRFDDEAVPGQPATQRAVLQGRQETWVVQVGDVILSMNGQPIVMSADLPHLVGALKAGAKANLEVIREGKRKNVELTVGAIPDEGKELDALPKSGTESTSNRLGVSVGELTAEQLDKVRCPHCHSTDTTLRSAFGSTLCRAIRFCFNCKQGFEQFKPIS